VKGHGKAKEGGWPPKDKVGASPLKSLNSNIFCLQRKNHSTIVHNSTMYYHILNLKHYRTL
jgi:hypothetical protein